MYPLRYTQTQVSFRAAITFTKLCEIHRVGILTWHLEILHYKDLSKKHHLRTSSFVLYKTSYLDVITEGLPETI